MAPKTLKKKTTKTAAKTTTKATAKTAPIKAKAAKTTGSRAGKSPLIGWTATEDVLYREFETKNYAESVKILNGISKIAEKLDHHPDIQLGWGYLHIALTTHDVGGVTEKDYELAARIGAAYPIK